RTMAFDDGRAIALRFGARRGLGGARRARRPHDEARRLDRGESVRECAGAERRIGRDQLEEAPPTERRDRVVRPEVGMLSARGGTDVRPLDERGDGDVELRGAPEEMIAGRGQTPEICSGRPAVGNSPSGYFLALNVPPSSLLVVTAHEKQPGALLPRSWIVAFVEPVRAAAMPVGSDVCPFPTLFLPFTASFDLPGASPFRSRLWIPCATPSLSLYLKPSSSAFQHGLSPHVAPARSIVHWPASVPLWSYAQTSYAVPSATVGFPNADG